MLRCLRLPYVRGAGANAPEGLSGLAPAVFAMCGRAIRESPLRVCVDFSHSKPRSAYSLPPRGRGTALAVEGACAGLASRKFHSHALSFSRRAAGCFSVSRSEIAARLMAAKKNSARRRRVADSYPSRREPWNVVAPTGIMTFAFTGILSPGASIGRAVEAVLRRTGVIDGAHDNQLHGGAAAAPVGGLNTDGGAA